MRTILVVNLATALAVSLCLSGRWVAAAGVLAVGLIYGWYQTTWTATRRWATRNDRRAAQLP